MIKNPLSHSSNTSLDEWLSYLENLHVTEIELGLTRISQVAKRLNIDVSFANVITVAGTNGKGTTCAFIENAMLAENRTVAVYSSPHIERFNERLRINKKDVADEAFVHALKQIEIARGDTSLTYYEYTTLAALLVLMVEKPDVIILEVGLGGRLDATNFIDANIAVITAIDLDHQAFLGDTREAIGFEKAGIMRPHTCAIVGDTDCPQSILTHANNIHANILVRNTDFSIQTSDNTWSWRNHEQALTGLNKPFIPQDNVATAIQVLAKCQVVLTTEKVNDWINQTKVPGRTEVFQLENGLNVMLDVGHNPHATRYLAQLISERSEKNIHAVVAMLSDKDIKNSLLPLNDVVSNWYIGQLDIPRAENVQTIATHVPVNNESVNCFDNIIDAYKMAISKANNNDLVLVFGSFFTVSAIRTLLTNS